MFSAKDYARENKLTRPKNYSVKTKLPTRSKTTKHKCSQCTNKNAKQYQVSEKETRWLCPEHLTKFLRRNDKERPNYIKASVLHH